MKYLLFLLMTVISIISCGNPSKNITQKKKGSLSEMMEIKATLSDPDKKEKYGRLVLDMDEHDFGDIKEGEIVTQLFRFTNKGEGTLLIHECQATCGCTVPNWPKEPIPPGGVGDIEIKFNSRGKSGSIGKSIIIITNGKPNKEGIIIRANVISS